MGAITARGYAEAVDEGLASLEIAISLHLRTNHFPPVPASMVGPCIEAIEAIEADDTSRLISLPEGVTWRGKAYAPAYAMADGHHLWDFIEQEEE